jgi:hypothetical protein
MNSLYETVGSTDLAAVIEIPAAGGAPRIRRRAFEVLTRASA